MCVATILLVHVAGEATGQTNGDELPGASPAVVEAIALELNSPFSRIPNVSWDAEYRTYQGDLPGAGDQTGLKNVFSFSWPFRLDNGNSLLLSAAIPVLGDQPAWQPSSGLEYTEVVIRQVPEIDPSTGAFIVGHDHLGDISFSLTYGNVDERGSVTSFGIANIAQTSEDGTGKRNQWLMGPQASFARYTSWGLVGARATHLTDIYGEAAALPELKTNETTLELFLSYAYRDGWQFESRPVILYDWEAVSGNKWSVPISAGMSKTSILGRLPVKIAFDLQHFVIRPDRFGPEWLFRFTLGAAFSTQGRL